jgi:hypothetical protein
MELMVVDKLSGQAARATIWLRILSDLNLQQPIFAGATSSVRALLAMTVRR